MAAVSVTGRVAPSIAATIDPSAPAAKHSETLEPKLREPFKPAVAPNVAATVPGPLAPSQTSAPAAPSVALRQATAISGATRLLAPDVKATVLPGTILEARRHPPAHPQFQGPRFQGTQPDVRATIPPSVTSPFSPAPAAQQRPLPVRTPEKTEQAMAENRGRVFVSRKASPVRAADPMLRVLRHDLRSRKIGADAEASPKLTFAIKTPRKSSAAAATPKAKTEKDVVRVAVLDKTSSGRKVALDAEKKALLSAARISTRMAGGRRAGRGRLVSILQH